MLHPSTKLTSWAVAAVLSYKFDTYTEISSYERCLFFYIGGKDEIIPAWRGWRLYQQVMPAFQLASE